MVRFNVEKSWLMAIPFDVFPMSVIVLLLIVMVPVLLAVELITAIPLSLLFVMVLSVASSVKVVTGVARTMAEPPLFDMVLEETVVVRAVIAPEVCRYRELDVFVENVLSSAVMVQF